MTAARTLLLRLGVRARLLLQPEQRDRGDLPAKAIIYAGLAIIAVAVVAWATAYVQGYLDSAPGAGGAPDGP